MNIEEIDIKDIEFGEPIEEKEPNYRDGYIRGIYRARNIIDNQQQEIERLNKQIEEYQKALDETTSEKEDLENIIKEVRKYIEKYDFITGYYEYNYDDENDTYTHYTVKEELLEILDKENI